MTLEERMRRYESVNRLYFIRRLPVIVRVDGKSFKHFTQIFLKEYPQEYNFSTYIRDALIESAIKCINDIQGVKCAYIQSDEISFLITDFDNLNTEAPYDYNREKIISDFTSTVTVAFNKFMWFRGFDCSDAKFLTKGNNFPEDEVVNYFVWRQNDASRNSLSKFCRNFFSATELLEKQKNDMHEMLYGVNKNWAIDLPDSFKNGVFVTKTSIYDECPVFSKNREIIDQLMIKNYEYKDTIYVKETETIT